MLSFPKTASLGTFDFSPTKLLKNMNRSTKKVSTSRLFLLAFLLTKEVSENSNLQRSRSYWKLKWHWICLIKITSTDMKTCGMIVWFPASQPLWRRFTRTLTWKKIGFSWKKKTSLFWRTRKTKKRKGLLSEISSLTSEEYLIRNTRTLMLGRPSKCSKINLSVIL